MKLTVKILGAAKKYWGFLGVALFATLFNSILSLISPQIIRQLIALVEKGDPETFQKSLRLALIFLILAALQLVFQFLRSYLNHLAAWRFVEDLRVRLYDHIQNLSMRFFHDKQTGQLMSRILNDTATMELFIAHAAPDLISNLIIFAGVILVMFLMNPTLALASLTVVPLIATGVWIYATRVRPLFRGRHQKNAELSGVLQDNLSGVKEIQIFNREEKEASRVAEVSRAFTSMTLAALKRSAVIHPLITFFNQLGTVLVIAVGGYLAARRGIPASDIVVFFLYISKFYEPINSLARLNEDLQDSLAAGERIFELLEQSGDVKEAKKPIDIGTAKGHITFKNVCFAYNENLDVLTDFSLDIAAGETVALVGPTGVGKTTIASLTTRFYDPVSGEVLLDGINIKKLSLKSLRANISFVSQDVFLFHGSVADNIAYGADSASMEQIIHAAKIANAHDFIAEMEDGYDTIVGERGVRLSGGQKQRISIARALLLDRPILILDEATASVDNTTEQLIHEAIDSVIANRTTLIIAHRLSTIKNADKIAVISDGAVAELGVHDELIKKGGLYAALYTTHSPLKT